MEGEKVIIVILAWLVLAMSVVLTVALRKLKQLCGPQPSKGAKAAKEPDMSPTMRTKALEILGKVSSMSGVPVEDLKGESRSPSIVAARVLFTELCGQEYITDAVTAEAINKERTTVVHYRNRYKPSEFYNILKTNYIKGNGSNIS
jgi:hypothetical protein